jgi:NADPH2:quinone reductase
LRVKAIEVASFGGPEVLRMVDRDAPAPGPGEVLIRVEAIGLNWSDLLQRAGAYPGGPTPPFIAGQEAAGIVVAHGEGVSVRDSDAPTTGSSAPPIGARVCVIGRGLAAEQAVVPAAMCFAWEASAEQRAALPISLLTAYHSLAPYAGRIPTKRVPGAPDTVVVHAAAGALGHVATQVARKLGMLVIGTASRDKRALVDADVVCGYEELREIARDGVDLVLDGVGGTAFRDSLAVLKPRGIIVILGASSGEMQVIDSQKLLMRSQTIVGLHLRHVLANGAELARSIEACRALDVKARVTTMPMTDIAKAHERLQNREVTGKLVLTW